MDNFDSESSRRDWVWLPGLIMALQLQITNQTLCMKTE